MSGNAKFSWFFLLPSSINMMTNKKYLGLLILAVLPNFGCFVVMQELTDDKRHHQKTTRDIIIESQKRILKNPNDANAYFMLGFEYDLIGEYEKAIQPWKKLIQLKPDSHSPHLNLGYAYEKLGRIDEAIKEYRAALKIAPEAKYLDSNLYDQVWSGMLREKEGD